MRIYSLIVGTLCVWRITHLLNAEDGPWNLMARLRRGARDGFWGSLLDCFYCLSLWIALPFASFLGGDWKERLLLWPALSGGAILMERIASRAPAPPPAPYYEETKGHVMLREEEEQRDFDDSRRSKS